MALQVISEQRQGSYGHTGYIRADRGPKGHNREEGRQEKSFLSFTYKRSLTEKYYFDIFKKR